MKPNTRIAIAALLSAAGAALTAFASEFGGDEKPDATPEPPAPAKAPKKAKKEEPAPAPAETPGEPETGGEATGGKTYEELRALIKPLVEGGQGAEVKAVIAKYSATGLKDMEAKHHAAFEKDIAALGY